MSPDRDLEEKIREAWDDMACGYDKFVSDAYSYVKMVEMPVVTTLSGDLDGKEVLDLGVGSGVYALAFAHKGARVTGLDISKKCLDLVQEKARSESVDVDLVRGSISDLGIFNRQFDMVFSSTTMHYVKDIEGTFRQVNGLLKNGGTFLLSVVHPFYTATYPLADYRNVDKYATFGLRYFSGQTRKYVPPWAKYCTVNHCISYHHTVEDYFNALAAAGFTIERMVEPRPLPVLKERHPRRYYEMMNTPVFMIFKCHKM
jgi:ubiquinone/menaquinone biosynthesis C-methylase UbiE